MQRLVSVGLLVTAAFISFFFAHPATADVPMSLLSPSTAPTSTAPASLWDDQRYIHVADVKRGMAGYGLSVFSGTKIDRFDVEVVDVLRNFNPKYDIILIRCKGDFLEHVGAVAGMSGSPIFLYPSDDLSHQHPRMAGAFAYGWPMTKDPVAGVQPIEYMLSIPPSSATRPSNGAAARLDATGATPQITGLSKPRWSLFEAMADQAAGRVNQPVESRDLASAPALMPLTTPLIASGMSSRVLAEMGPQFARHGLTLLQGGGSSATTQPSELSPGCVLAVPLLTGDMELAALGTCTEIRGDRLFAFGHSFNNEGPISLPMSSGSVAMIVANLQTSFKLGAVGPNIGTLTADQTVGVAGQLGSAPTMIPIELSVHYDDGSLDTTYRFNEAFHPKLSPLITGMAISAALGTIKELPQYHTLDYDLALDFADGKTVRLVNTQVNGGPGELFQELSIPIEAGTDNPFDKVLLAKISGTIRVKSEAREADITSISLSKLKYNPGDLVKAFITYRPWRSAEQTMSIAFELPKDLPNGKYAMVISDWQRYFADERQVEPFRYTAQSVDEMFAVVRDYESIRHDAIYVRLLRQPTGVAVGRAAMPRLPVSMRSVLLGAGRSDMTAFMTSTVKTFPTDLVMNGAADFELTIDHNSRVASVKTIKPASQPAAQ